MDCALALNGVQDLSERAQKTDNVNGVLLCLKKFRN